MSKQSRKNRTPEELATLVEDLGAKGMVAQDFGIRIDREGNWHHQGRRIERIALVKLFASILTRLDNGEYWLVTPAERGQIKVEDKPFVITRTDVEGEGRSRKITFYTNLDDALACDANHSIHMEEGEDTPEMRPYVKLGGNLEARISRTVYYDLADMAEAEDGRFVLWSHGACFDLGPTRENES
jgi:hypothetical protein